ncbi:hypothetical protein HZS_1514 [Henneguya salminicola]|nr:hypothetical protein HZS_1514 [Henneguya salminicola]
MHSLVSLGKSSEYFKIFNLSAKGTERTTQKYTRPAYNQINWQSIELMERRDIIPIIALLE